MELDDRGVPLIDQSVLEGIRRDGAAYGDHELVDVLIAELVESVPPRLDALASAAGSSDPRGVAREAHRLKGSFAQVGAKAASERMAALDRSARGGVVALPDVEATLRVARRTLEVLEHRGALGGGGRA